MNDPYIHYWRVTAPETACGISGFIGTTSTSEKLVTCPFCRIAKGFQERTVKQSLTVGARALPVGEGAGT